MTTRMSNEERRRQIVAATLDLLAEHPVPGITTRLVAGRVGITQPGLFRHFRSRDAILVAVVDATREQLAGLAEGVLAGGGEPMAGVEALVRGLLQHVGRHPGMPRLLFHDVAGEDDGRFRNRLEALVDAQRALIARLVDEAREQGRIPATVDPRAAGRLLVALIQGVLLQWELGGRARDLEAEGRALLGLWRAGVESGVPSGDAAVAREPGREALVALDVRPILASGRDPLDAILEAHARVAPDGMLNVIAPFRPAPLLALFERQGQRVAASEVVPGVWRVEVRAPEVPEPLDLRDGEPGEPLARILQDAAALEPGQGLFARVPRVPRLLFPHLEERGLRCCVHEEPDETALIHVRRPR